MYTEDQIEELIFRYLSGKSTPEEESALTLWVLESPEHKHRYRQARNIWQVANPVFAPDDIETEKAKSRVMRKIVPVAWYRIAVVYWQRVAAILIVPLIVLSAYLWFGQAGDKESPVSYQQIFAPYGTHSKVKLPDGSIAWLNAGSTLEFPTVFKKGERTVRLTGEAFFEVESDTENPFIVETNRLHVKATGTAFNVEAYEKDSITAVTMAEGKIAVAIDGKKPFPMVSGERMKYNLNHLACQVIKADPYKWCAWKDGLMVFRDDPLSEVFKRIGQTFNVDIEIKDAEIARHLYRATFEDESLDEILRLLKLTAPIRYKKFDRDQSSGGIYKKQRIEVYKDKG